MSTKGLNEAGDLSPSLPILANVISIFVKLCVEVDQHELFPDFTIFILRYLALALMKRWNICGALRDLVLFVQFKKRKKHPWRSVNFSRVAGFMQLLHASFPLPIKLSIFSSIFIWTSFLICISFFVLLCFVSEISLQKNVFEVDNKLFWAFIVKWNEDYFLRLQK